MLGATPEVFRKIGLNALPMTINQRHIDYALNGTKNADHELSLQDLKQLPRALENPIAIIHSPQKPGTSLIAIIQMRSKNGKQVISAVYVDGAGTYNGKVIDSNAVTTIHGRNNAVRMLAQAIQLETQGATAVYWLDKKRSQSLLQGSSSQLTTPLIHDGFYHSIRESGARVNGKIENVTQSLQFKRWFGDWEKNPNRASKVVNEDGTPKVVYHGTNQEFHTFQSQNGAYFFSESQDYAESMAEERGGDRVIQAYLDMRRPLRVEMQPGEFSDPNDEAKCLREAKAKGHDGVIFTLRTGNELVDDTFYAVFDSAQIKSATENIGTFDKAERDIRYSVEDETDAQKNSTRAYSLDDKISMGLDDAARYQILKDRSLTAAKVNPRELGENSTEQLEQLAKANKSVAFRLLKKIGEEFGVFRDYKTEAFNLEFAFSKRNLLESVNKQGKRYDNYALMLTQMKDIVENAVGIETHNKRYGEEGQIKQTYVFVSAMQTSENIVPILLEVRTFNDGTKSTLRIAVSMSEIKRSRVMGHTLEDTRSNQSYPTGFAVRIADLFANVNSRDGRLLKYIPDGFLNEAQRDGKQAALQEQAAYDSRKKAQRDSRKAQDDRYSAEDDAKSRDLARELDDAQKAMTAEELRAIQSIGNKSVNQFTSEDIRRTNRYAQQYWKEMGAKSPFFRAWFGDWRAADQTQVLVAKEENGERGAQRNTDTGWDINISRKVFDEAEQKRARSVQSGKMYLPYIRDIVKKAVLLDTRTLKEGRAKSNNSLLMHSLYAVADNGSGPVLLKLYVEEMNNPNSASTGKRAYELQNIEYQQPGVKGSGVTPSLITQAADIRTIADLYAAVKAQDRKFSAGRAVNPVLLNEDGTPKVFYHGTGASFTAFDIGQAAAAEGSFFFAENPEAAAAYGNDVMKVYLSGEKLADYDNQPHEFYRLHNKREQVAYLKKRGYDGWYADMDSGGWGEVSVFSPTQIKSATDNIGTFDRGEEDIRYSVDDETDAARQNDRQTLQEHEVQTALWDAMDHADRGDDNVIKLGRMPRYVRTLTGIDGDFYIYRNHAYENMATREQAEREGRPTRRGRQDIHFHGLGIDTMTEAILRTEDPLVTIWEKSKDGNPVISMVLPVKDADGAPLYAVMGFYTSNPINGQMKVRPHVLLTISNRALFGEGRRGTVEAINDAIAEKRILGMADIKKVRANLTLTSQHTKLTGITVNALSQNVAQFQREVKQFRAKNMIH